MAFLLAQCLICPVVGRPIDQMAGEQRRLKKRRTGQPAVVPGFKTESRVPDRDPDEMQNLARRLGTVKKPADRVRV